MLKYDAKHYDDHLRLKISPLLWLVLIYGIRHICFMVAAKLMPIDPRATPWLGLQTHAMLMLGDLPALLVLFANGHRMPNALKVMRWIWLHGRWALACSYLSGLAAFLYLHQDVIVNDSSRDFTAALAIVLTDIAIIIYLMRSELVRDIFNEFPETEDEPATSSAAKPKTSSTIRQLNQELKDAKRNELLQQRIIAGDIPVDATIQTTDDPMKWMQSAARHEASGSPGVAESIYRELLKASPSFAPAWHALGLLAYHAGNHAYGVALLEQAILFDKAAGLYRRNLGEMYRRMGRVQKAVALGGEACQLSPMDADAFNNFALALTDAGRLKDALANYRAAIKLNPNHGLYWNNIGVALRATGDLEGAKHAFSQAVTLNPANVEAQKNLQALLASLGQVQVEEQQTQA